MEEQPILSPSKRRQMGRALDPRVARSRERLREAMVRLTIEKGFDQVTIREISEQAGVGFKTFYRHYANRDALMQDVLRSIVDDIVEQLVIGEISQEADLQNAIKIFEYVRTNEAFFRVIIDLSVLNLMIEPLLEITHQVIAATSPHLSKESIPLSLIVHKQLWELIGYIRWWLENGMEPPVEEMALYYVNLS